MTEGLFGPPLACTLAGRRGADLFFRSGAMYKPNQALKMLYLVNFTPSLLLDCGPADGREAWRFRERWPQLPIVGFEPAAHLYDLREYPGTLVHKAVWDKAGRAPIVHGPRQSTLVRTGDREPLELVETVRLDEYWLGGNDIVLWMDIEGAELRALEGARKLLEAGAIRLINIEVYDETQEQIAKFLEQFGLEMVLAYEQAGLHHDEVFRLRAT